MEMRALGRTGLSVSAIGLGTVKIGRTDGLKLARQFTLPGDDEVGRLIDCALDLGVTLFDTAPAYGLSEERLGRALRGRRQRAIIASKAGETFAAGVSRYDFSASAIRQSVEASLARLGTEVIDILSVHSDGIEDASEQRFGAAVDELDRLKARGLIRFTGFSAKTPAGGRWAVARCDTIMVTLNAGAQAERSTIAEAGRAGRGVLVKKALESGHAADPAAALRFALAAEGVSCVVVGTLNPAHLADLAAVSR